MTNVYEIIKPFDRTEWLKLRLKMDDARKRSSFRHQDMMQTSPDYRKRYNDQQEARKRVLAARIARSTYKDEALF